MTLSLLLLAALPYLTGQSVKDGRESHLAESLDLSYGGLAEVEVLGQVQADLTTSSVFADLEVTALLQVRVEGEEENCPAEGGGGGVGSSQEHVIDRHHQLVRVKVRVVCPLLLYQEDVNIILWIVLIQLHYSSVSPP